MYQLMFGCILFARFGKTNALGAWYIPAWNMINCLLIVSIRYTLYSKSSLMTIYLSVS